MLTSDVQFLTVDDIKQIHKDQIANYGGSAGIRDEGLLSSAVAQPQAGIGDQYLHPTLPEMAAAYLFHLVMNHPFVDGNKRTALATALVFLELNGWELDPSLDELEKDGKTKLETIVVSVTTNQTSKQKLTDLFKAKARPQIA